MFTVRGSDRGTLVCGGSRGDKENSALVEAKRFMLILVTSSTYFIYSSFFHFSLLGLDGSGSARSIELCQNLSPSVAIYSQ